LNTVFGRERHIVSAIIYTKNGAGEVGLAPAPKAG